MDKLVDHLFIFEGDGAIYDFPGNYSDYRVSQKQQVIETRREEQFKSKPSTTDAMVVHNPVRKKHSFKEKREFEQLTMDIEQLEKEKALLENEIDKGNLNADNLIKKSARISEIMEFLDKKTDRWLELSE
jgi:ATP-binding cassette subfamily F protein uup